MRKTGPSSGMWQNIRLELAPTAEFPSGSATRAYLLFLPLHEDGTIDEAAVLANSQMARFKRLWPSEPERTGLIVRRDSQWALAFKTVEEGAPPLYSIEMDRLLPGDDAMIERHEQGRWQFRVVGLQRDGVIRP